MTSTIRISLIVRLGVSAAPWAGHRQVGERTGLDQLDRGLEIGAGLAIAGPGRDDLPKPLVRLPDALAGMDRAAGIEQPQVERARRAQELDRDHGRDVVE